MDLGFSDDQAMLRNVLERWADAHMAVPAAVSDVSYLADGGLGEELFAQGYYSALQQPELGALGAVLLIEAVGRTPRAIEVAASALLAPLFRRSNLPRPLALMSLTAPPIARFLAPLGAALIDAGDHVRLLSCNNRVTVIKSRYAYPFGRYDGELFAQSEALDDIDVETFRAWRCVGITAETVAAMRAALELTIQYVRTRVQFRRSIGSFQAVQHRLAECSVLLHGARLLLYRAASENARLSEEAAIVAHDAVKQIIYETGQFHGAIGLTLEYPLHFWTYRLRVLQFELAQSLAFVQ